MKLKLNIDLLKYIKGTVVDIDHKNGIPLDPFWRKRVIDSKVDNCVSILSEGIENKSNSEKQVKSNKLNKGTPENE